MGHNFNLIEKIITELKRDYQSPENKFVIEKKLLNSEVKIFPDIQIVNNKEILCVVEIGYTRPEKFKIYRTNSIPDIRWYGKNGELLNEQDVHYNKIIDVPVPTIDCTWNGIILLPNNIYGFCESCFKDAEQDIKCERCEDFEKEEECNECRKMNEKNNDDEVYYHYDVEYNEGWYGFIFSNGKRRFLIATHDICGEINIIYNDFELSGFYLNREFKNNIVDLETKSDFYSYFERLEREDIYLPLEAKRTIKGLTHEKMIEFVKEQNGETLDYSMCIEWKPDDHF